MTWSHLPPAAFNLLHVIKAPYHYVRLNQDAGADTAWWRCFLQAWNGSFFFTQSSPSCHVYSDASGNYGTGAIAEQHGWFQAQWPKEWEATDISAKELVPVVVVAALWGRYWSHEHVRFNSDNMVVVAVLKTGTAKEITSARNH